ncbi:MAG: hypothetical protein QXN37_04405 [Candidatus Anstonellaceae archaeon]
MRNFVQQNQTQRRGSSSIQTKFAAQTPVHERHSNILADKAAIKSAIQELKRVLPGEELHPAIFYRLDTALNGIRSRVNLGWSISVVLHSLKVLEQYLVERKEEARACHSTEKTLAEIARVLWARQGEIAELCKESLDEKSRKNLRKISCMLDSISYKLGFEAKQR